MASDKNYVETKGPRGQTVCTAYGRDDSSYKVNDGQAKSGKLGGSPTNLSHSLSGASAVQRHGGDGGSKGGKSGY